MTKIHLHDDIFIVGTCLIIGYPTSLNDLQLTIFDKLLDLLFLLGILSGVPHMEVLHLHIREGAIRVHH